MALSKTTQDHDEIRQWAESRGAIPAEVASTEKKGQTGILRLEFPKAKNANDSALQEISWEDFFEKFDATGLALVYQEQTAEGEQSNFNKLIYPEDAKDSKRQPAAKSSAGRAPARKAVVAKAPKRSTRAESSNRTMQAKAPAKKAAAKKTPAKKAPAKKAAAKAPAKKSPAKKAPAKKSPTKKAPAKRSTGR